jgi:hypothetical protein
VGDDSAVLVIDDEPPLESATQPSEAKAAKEGDAATPDDIETARIQKLIDLIRSNKGAVFIRNGQEHTPAEAADHLERKWKAAGAAITTAEEFIDKIASRSSTTGEPYRIQFDRGESDASEWLQLHLARIKKEEAPGSVNE